MAVVLLVVLGLTVGSVGVATAAVVPTVPLGTAASFGVLGGSTVTNTGPTVVNGLNVGVSPGSAITGFDPVLGPGIITPPGTLHAADDVAANAQADALIAYNNAFLRKPAPADQGLTDLAGKTLEPGVYQGDLSLSGTVVLDNSTNPDAVFIFQASSTLITAPGSVVRFTNTTHASCNVFWQVGSSATLGTNSTFIGTILAQTSVTAQTGAKIDGRLLARTGAVTLDSNVITAPSCAAVTTRSSTPSSSTSTGVTGTSSGSVTVPTTPPTGTGTSGTGTSTSPSGQTTTSGTTTLISTTSTTPSTSTGTSTSAPNQSIPSVTIPVISTTPTTPSTSTGTSTSAPKQSIPSVTIPVISTTPTTPSTTTTTTAASTPSTSSSSGLTTSTAITTTETTRLTQPSFPTGVPGGVGPTAPPSPLKIIGTTLLMLGIGLLLWRNPTARRRMTGWTRFLAGSAKRTGDHR